MLVHGPGVPQRPAGPAVVERILANGNRAPRPASPRAIPSWYLRAATIGPGLADDRAAGQKLDPAEMAVPLLVVPLACKSAYLDHYAELDKG